jgi:hypothetical protein
MRRINEPRCTAYPQVHITPCHTHHAYHAPYTIAHRIRTPYTALFSQDVSHYSHKTYFTMSSGYGEFGETQEEVVQEGLGGQGEQEESKGGGADSAGGEWTGGG